MIVSYHSWNAVNLRAAIRFVRRARDPRPDGARRVSPLSRQSLSRSASRLAASFVEGTPASKSWPRSWQPLLARFSGGSRRMEFGTPSSSIPCAKGRSAKGYLDLKQIPVAEAALPPGFSEQTACWSRAFKRWTGMSPIEYRQGNAPAPTRADDHPGRPGQASPSNSRLNTTRWELSRARAAAEKEPSCAAARKARARFQSNPVEPVFIHF